MVEDQVTETHKEDTKDIKDESKYVEKVLTLNLRKYFLPASKYKRAKKAMNVLRRLLIRHTKSKNIKISEKINRYIWNRGIKNPPHKITVKILKREDIAYVDLYEEK